jgi:Aerobic-type carbon monoxide dehydrogenase, middle subunit CoxM/CutM homologs
LKPAPFAYAKARSVAHAIELLANDDARLLAGGQSLIATLNMRLSEPALLVDINAIGGLDRVALKNAHVEIGALVRYAQAERSTEIARAAPLIALALPHIGHPAIRNRGTRRRLARLRRSGRRTAGVRRRTRWRNRNRRAARATHGQGR